MKWKKGEKKNFATFRTHKMEMRQKRIFLLFFHSISLSHYFNIHLYRKEKHGVFFASSQLKRKKQRDRERNVTRRTHINTSRAYEPFAK
jgi:hypothetical protein